VSGESHNTLVELENKLCERLRLGKMQGESFQFTLLKALRDVIPTANDPAYLAQLYAEAPYTLNEFDEGGVVAELLYHNVRRHLTDFANHWANVTGGKENNVVHPTEWR